MSTPSGKPFDPFDISAYAPKRVRQRSAADQEDEEQFSPAQPGADDDLAPVFQYAVKREWPRAAAQADHPIDLDQRDVAAPAAERGPEGPLPAVQELGDGTEVGAGEDVQHGCATGSAPMDGEAERDDRLDFADAPGLGHAIATPEPPADPDSDIEALESSLRWLHREGTAGRLPRATQLPPVRGLAPTRAVSRKSDTYINGYRLPRSLEPEFVPPPPMRARGDHLRGPMRILIASLVAAPIAYYFTTGGILPDWLAGRGAKFISLEAPVPARAPAARASDAAESLSTRGETVGMLPPLLNRETNPVVPPAPVAQAAAAERVSGKDSASLNQAAVSPRREMASAEVGVSAMIKDSTRASSGTDQASAPSQPVHRLDPEDIKLLVRQGEQFVAAGDLVTARVVFQRAAEAGDAMGALAMGATYDPVVLARLGVRGIGADVEKARSWYQKARDFGSPEAPHRLEMLANR